MESKKEQLITEVVYQGNHTYEIKKTIDGFKGDKAILIGLYPTVDGDNITKIDSTQLHLINHMKELGLNEVRIMNLYSEVFDRNGSEYWSARELAFALDYVQWRNFEKVIKRAMIACENSGHNVLDDFAEVSKIVEAGATHKSTKDYELSRYACYFSKCRLYGTLWRS